MKTSKKILSLLLALLMIFSMASFAFATETYKQNCPVIFIPGFSSSDIYTDINDPSTQISFPDANAILTAVADTLVPALAAYAINKDTDKLTDTVTKRINEMCAPLFNEKSGDPKQGSGIAPREIKSASKKSRFTFRYDWRGDPMIIADELNKFIETIRELSGCDKVALGCHSLGSSIALAYLSKYGNSAVSAIVLDSPACNGVDLIGNVLTGNINLDAKSIGLFLKEILGDMEYKKLVSGFIDIMQSAGLFEMFSLFADEVIAELAPGIYRGTVAPLVGRWTTIWSMLPDDKMDEAKAYIFDEILKDEDTSVLEAKIDNYNSVVRNNRTKTLKSFDKLGRLAIFSRYTNQTIPLVESSIFMSDTIIDTKSTSFGATTAPIGEYFSDEYLKGKDMAYISPDRTVDASTCLFPEKTWFIKGSGHFETGGVTENYYDMFFFAKKELTCDTAEIGRFTYRDEATYSLVEDTTTPQKIEKPDFIRSLYNLISALLEVMRNLINSKIA